MSLTDTLRVARVGVNESLQVRRRARRAMRLALLRALMSGTEEGPTKKRTIFDAHNGQRVGNQVRTEGEPSTGDPAVDEAYQFMGDTFDFYWNVYHRNSIDNEGMPLEGTVHFGRDYDNAFWDGRRMFYGDGDGEQFTRFTKSIDVVGHELTHGVTEFAAGLIYWDQPGALNESVSDVFGSLVKQYVRKQTAAQADWLIGDDLFIPGTVQGVAIRSMKAPGTAYDDPVLGKDPQPAHMRDFVRTFQDSRGVHINSGIPNHAFYQVSVNLDGYAWEKAGLIWYETLNSPRLRRTANFQSFARLTFATAQRLYPSGVEQDAVRDGWAKVGIKV
jgi:Zn-dependent metalloprotease